MSYRLGDAVSVRIAGVDSDTRKIDFVLEGGVKKGAKARASDSAQPASEAKTKSRRGSRKK